MRAICVVRRYGLFATEVRHCIDALDCSDRGFGVAECIDQKVQRYRKVCTPKDKDSNEPGFQFENIVEAHNHDG